MALAWSKEWHAQHMVQCREDKDFQDEAEGYDRTVTIHVLADPDNGVPEDNWHGFNPPQMTEVWWGEEKAGNTSYIAMFVPAVERFYELSRNITDSYEGSYKLDR